MAEYLSPAEVILDRVYERSGREGGDLTLQELGSMSSQEYTTVLDGIIDRTFTDTRRQQELQKLLATEVCQRYYERQVASVSILAPLMPWWVHR